MKRFLVVVLVFTVLVSVVLVVAFFGLGFYLSPQGTVAKADVIVAISGGETKARTKEAVKLYTDGWSDHIIFSGAALDPNSPSNAETMARTAIDLGVPASAITLDETAANTRQNAAGVAKVVRDQGYRSIILVTSPYHQRRADITFRRALGSGVGIINHSSYDQNWRRLHWWATSYSRNLTISEIQKVAYELAAGSK